MYASPSTLKSVGETPCCYHSNKISWAELLCSTYCIIGKGLRESFLIIVYNRGMFRPGDVNFFSCSSVDECKDTLIQFGVQDITPAAVARVVGEEIHLYLIL